MLGFKRDCLPAPTWTSARHGARTGMQWKGPEVGSWEKCVLTWSLDSVKPLARWLVLVALMVPTGQWDSSAFLASQHLYFLCAEDFPHGPHATSTAISTLQRKGRGSENLSNTNTTQFYWTAIPLRSWSLRRVNCDRYSDGT